MTEHDNLGGCRPSGGGFRAWAPRWLTGWLLVLAGGLAQAQMPAPVAPRPTLRIVGLEVPPLITAGPAGVQGLVVEIVTAAVRQAGYEPRIDIMPWARAYAEVRDQRVDALIPTIRSPQREAELAFGDQPIFVSEQSLFFRNDAAVRWRGDVTAIHGLDLIKLAGALTAAQLDQAIANRQVTVHEAANYALVMRMLAGGRGQVAMAPKLIGQHALRVTGNSHLIQAAEPPLAYQPFYLAFNQAPHLAPARQALDQALARMWADGTVQRIVAAHKP